MFLLILYFHLVFNFKRGLKIFTQIYSRVLSRCRWRNFAIKDVLSTVDIVVICRTCTPFRVHVVPCCRTLLVLFICNFAISCFRKILAKCLPFLISKPKVSVHPALASSLTREWRKDGEEVSSQSPTSTMSTA